MGGVVRPHETMSRFWGPEWEQPMKLKRVPVPLHERTDRVGKITAMEKNLQS